MRSIEYPKTENLFNRDPETHKLIEGDFRVPAHKQIARWHVSEKIDGMNMRVVYEPASGQVSFRGRSDAANVPGDLLEWLQQMFTPERLGNQFDEFMLGKVMPGAAESASVTIFGEGYGPGIQKNGARYAPVKMFRAFDICYHWPNVMGGVWRDSWAQPTTTRWICESMGIFVAPFLGSMTVAQIVEHVRNRRYSPTASLDAEIHDAETEGIIARTDPYLYTERGSRVMFKLKGKDLA